jgi:hypothetical protein
MEGSHNQESLPIKVHNISRDEMNLAEFPLTVLSTRATSNLKTLEFKDTVRGKNGELVNRSWIITGADKFGLPTSSDDEILLGLLKLTVDEGFRDRKIYFTRYELLRILRWTTEGRNYVRLQKALDRLSGVRIKATNAFYDNETKLHSTRNFGILDGYELNDGRTTNPKPSFFTWSEVIFKSFQAGFIKKLDLDFYLGLESAVSKRLHRYLDKHFWYKSHLQVGLFILAHEKIGISRNYQYASSLRQQLDPALEELQGLGFISEFYYEGKGKETLVHIYAQSAKPRSLQSAKSENLQLNGQGEGLQLQVIQALSQRGLKKPQAEKLTNNRSEEMLNRMLKIVEHYDTLLASQSRLISRSPVGFLYRAVEHPEHFVLPTDKVGNGTADKGYVEKGSQTSFDFRSDQRPSANPGEMAVKLEALSAEYLTVRKKGLQNLRAEVEPEVLKRLTQEVESALSKLKSLISEKRYREAVHHGVEEKLAKLFAFPDFEEWLKLRRTRQFQ